MKRARKWLVGIGFLVLLLAAVEVVIDRMDEAANERFAEKARRLQIEGKSESFVREHFGPPAFVTRHPDDAIEPYHVLVYIPGSSGFLTYASYSKVRIDEQTGTVRGWMINSD